MALAADRGTYLNEVEYLAAESPGIGEYNIATSLTRKSFNMSRPSSHLARKPSEKQGRKTLQIINPILQGTFEFISKSKRKHNATFTKDRRFKVDIEQVRVPSPQHYTLKRVWSANRTDHFAKQISTMRNGSIYY